MVLFYLVRHQKIYYSKHVSLLVLTDSQRQRTGRWESEVVEFVDT